MRGDSYYEVQRFANKLTIGLAGVSSAVIIGVFGWGMVAQLALDRPWGSGSMSDTGLMIFGTVSILFTAVLGGGVMFLRMSTRVANSALMVRFWGIRVRSVLLEEIVDCEVVSVNSLRQSGGWGIRWRRGHGWTYNVASGDAVRIVLSRGGRLVIGSQRAEELASVISEGSVSD
jgi:hypothetical protein